MKVFVLKLLALLMLFSFSALHASAAASSEAAASTHKEESYQAQPFSTMISKFYRINRYCCPY